MLAPFTANSIGGLLGRVNQPQAQGGLLNGLRSFLSNHSNMLLGMGAGLLDHRQNANNSMGDVFRMGAQGGALDRERRDGQRSRQATINFLIKQRGMNPEEAEAVAWGDSAILSSLLKGGSADETFGVSPQLFRNEQGELVYGQFGTNGSFRPADTGDLKPVEPTRWLNTGTEHVPVSTRAGSDAAPVPIDVAGQREAQIEGENLGNKPKAAAALQSFERSSDFVVEKIDQAVAQADWTTAGFVGEFLNDVPGTPAYDLKQTLATIQANQGFAELAEMRENSPTGGALGNVSNLEVEFLQAVNGALAPGQSPPQLRANLERLAQITHALKEDRRQAFAATYGGAQPLAPQLDDPLGIR